MRAFVVGICLYLSIQVMPGAGHPRMMRTYLRPLGSVPPSENLFRCVDELNEKTYSDALVRECRTIIAALPFMQEVHINKSDMEDGRTLVEFVATAPSLKI